ncbi:MAG TPA: Pr6Pr family membrane protein, partial [Microbacterium sp.]|nr:Pr6Pr family membrane protein [Microbacterium sp.]
VSLTGVAAGFIVNLDRALRYGQDVGIVLANYVSLFTIVTSTLCAAALIAAIVWGRRHPTAAREPVVIAFSLAMTTGPMLLLAIVFNALLRGQPTAAALADPAGIHALDVWATEALHVVLPLLLLADLLFAPRRRGLPWWTLAPLVAYPIAWLGYTLVRGVVTPDPAGASIGWYPYPFLDPQGPAGWAGVAVYIGVMLGLLIVLDVAVIAIGRHRERHAHIGMGSAPRMPGVVA